MARKQLSAKERAAYEAGGFRFDPPVYDPDRIALVDLESAIQTLKSWTRRPKEIRAALAIPSSEALARWRRGTESVPWITRERVAMVSALRHRLTEAVDFVSLRPLPDLKRRGQPSVPGRAVLAGGLLSELLALLHQLVLEEEAAERRRNRRKQGRQ
jgi:hypothetical protein